MNSTEKPLRIKNAFGNNLKHISLELAHDTFTAITGVSGSGKSSLAFETIYAEGQRRYIETFSPYTRQFFDKVKKPQADLIENVRPAIAIQQRTRVTNSRSTVGSMSDVDDYLKVLWSNVATPVCPNCGIDLLSWPPKKVAAHLIKKAAVRQLRAVLIAAPLRSNEPQPDLYGRLAKLGLNRIIDPGNGQLIDLEDATFISKQAYDPLLILVDRLPPAAMDSKRIVDSVEQAYTLSGGTCTIGWIYRDDVRSLRPFVTVGNTAEQVNYRHGPIILEQFTISPTCPAGIKIPSPKRALFSYNHPLGACPTCKGFGHVLDIDIRRCIPDGRKSIAEDAMQCWSGPAARGERRKLLRFCKEHEIDTEAPWFTLSEEQHSIILHHSSREFRGILPWFKKIERKAYKMHVRVFLSRYRTQKICPECYGARITKEALAFQVKGKNLADLWSMNLEDLHSWMVDLKGFHGAGTRDIDDTISAVLSRLTFLRNLGLGYLTLNRQARTLSGGETQRVNLATALGSELVSTHFVLDEPSVGLHPRDTDRLISSLKDLHRRGNTLLIVEHDPDCIMAAEHVLELGPGPGKAGGEIVYQGETAKWQPSLIPRAETFNSQQLSCERPSSFLEIRRVSARNLRDFSTSLPLGAFVCLTGVSGSGKSTLIDEVIKKAAEENQLGILPQHDSGVFGFEQLEQVLLVDQSPLAKSPRANTATYTGIWSVIRTKLAGTDQARERGLSKSVFSFNVDGGRCPACKGAGFLREDMQFLSDVYIPCELCLGARFQPTVLNITYQGKNVLEFLEMTAEEAVQFFPEDRLINEPAKLLCELGLGHLTLGHPLSELSGGESQRLKLVPFLSQASKRNSLLLFDEPTTGLHTRDIERLITLIRKLRDRGHSIVCVEHNLILILAADWIIDLGPEGGAEGGRLVMEGTPQSFLAKSAASISHTARHLQRYYRTLKGRRTAQQKKEKGVPLHQPEAVLIRGAREHNLKNINLEVPLRKLVALTGISGSGKSTIAKDIIYAEGQRRYLDCLSPYARQFIKELKKPELDGIQNIPPTLCVYQHTFQPSQLSTVATMSEIYNFLRLLFAKIAVQFCPDHPAQAISAGSFPDIAAQIKGMSAKQIRILAPVIKLKKGLHKQIFSRAISSEIGEVRVDGVFATPARFLTGLERAKAHSIDFTVAKFNPQRVALDMIEEAAAHAMALGGGSLIVQSELDEQLFSMDRTCAVCGRGFFKPDPEDLSFNSRRGACPRCAGRGSTPSGAPCRTCGGSRLGEMARNLKITAASIFDFCDRPATELSAVLAGLSFSRDLHVVAEPILRELSARLRTLSALGLDYLRLSRDCRALSSGELQRLRLAAALGSPLSGVLYILDEPSAGLHPQDNRRVLEHLKMLKEQNNSVIIIEHDSESISACDHIIEVGPGGGTAGGRIVYSGPMKEFRDRSDTLTAQALQQELSKPPKRPIKRDSPEQLSVRNATANNLKELNLDVPLQQLVVVAGVSGAGKSSLVHTTIADTISCGKGGKTSWKRNGTALQSTVEIGRVLLVDQAPIGKNSRSTPASFLGVWNEIRALYASTPQARAQGLSTGYFSYNTGKGRCADCRGRGNISLEMSFLADASIVCESCGGRRYSEQAESIHYLNLSISAALQLTFEQARGIFINHRKIHRSLQRACELGLGYLTLGQDSGTLSGGESQRLKLVAELSAARKIHTLYILDEPTTGLHRTDVAKLIGVLQALVAEGHSVMVIEHDRDVIAAADHIVELGPGPGEAGGRIVFQGSPAKLASSAKTPWGEIFREDIP